VFTVGNYVRILCIKPIKTITCIQLQYVVEYHQNHQKEVVLVRRSKKYYLKMMSHGQITDEEVAVKLNTSVQNVRKAFVEYSQNRNPFRPLNFKLYLELISILLVLLTLFEMKISRNNAYLPDILFNNTTFAVTWNENGFTLLGQTDDEMSKKLITWVDHVNEIPKIKLTNIGVGTAKYVQIEWEYDNLETLVEYLYEVNDKATFTFRRYGESDNLIINDNIYTSSKPYREIAYMKNESEEELIVFPYEYWECIRESCIHHEDLYLPIPDLQLVLRYSDVQGKRYTVKKTITIDPLMRVVNPDNSGYAVFEIRETDTDRVGRID